MIHSTEKRLIMAMDDFLKETESEIALSKTTADLLGGKKKNGINAICPPRLCFSTHGWDTKIVLLCTRSVVIVVVYHTCRVVRRVLGKLQNYGSYTKLHIDAYFLLRHIDLKKKTNVILD